MFSKVYTCENESILAGFIPFSTPKFRFYRQGEIPFVVRNCLEEKLKILKAKVWRNFLIFSRMLHQFG
uniref:Uncharacterized protein n=1 Tax=Rhizophora mucronata TaxID=61149 RepID=A0A2P2QCQ4_RHIMU